MRAKSLFKKSLVKVFHLGQRLGVDILPRHFYSEIPDINRLRRTTAWRAPFSMIGVEGAELDPQLQWAADVMNADIRRHLQAHDVHADAKRENGEAGFGPMEAQFLFAFVARHRPARIVQIGCGVSTALCLAAGRLADYKPHITCVEPYPSDYLKAAAARGDIQLIAKPVEDVGLDFFAQLADGDMFFVDSSHTLGPAGEVTRIVLEMLPRVKKNVFVHFHDVTFPYDYWPSVLDNTVFFRHESPLLHAFLCMNPGYAICASLAQLHHARLAELTPLFHNYRPTPMKDGLTTGPGHYPTSIYLKALSGPSGSIA